MAAFSEKIELTSPEETQALALSIAPLLRGGDVLLLEGEIGAGKTHFARCIIQSLLDEYEDVPSPTFTLVQTYDSESGEIWHADLYRLSSPDEIVELGLTDAFEDSICLVEWPDRLEDLTPDQALTLSFKMQPEEGHRELRVQANDPRWASFIKEIANA